MKTILLILAFAAILASCSKQPDAYVLGTWKIEQQILATYNGLDKTNESITELHQAFMEFNEDGSGKLIHAATEIPFTYIVTVDEIILSSEICRQSTWYIIENIGSKMVIEHTNPSMVTVRYLTRVDEIPL
jgi:hypothetical protein